MTPAYSKFPTVQKYYPQWLSGIGVTMVILQVGIMCGWSSPYLARLTAPDSPLPLTPEEACWVASLLNLGRFLGAVSGAVSLHYLGSKRCLLLSVIPMCFCWIFIMTAKSCYWLYLGRAAGGLGLGMVYSCFPLYLGEVALPEIRGALISLAMSGGGSTGVLISSICGSYLPMNVSAAAYLVICVLVFILLLWLPESPHWLVKIGDYKGAKQSIEWYQRSKHSEKELEIVKSLVALNDTESFNDKLQKFKSGPIRRAIVLIIFLFTFAQVTGINTILFYMETILLRGKITFIDPSLVVICVNASGILGTVVSMYLIDKCGRRFLLIISSTLMTIAMAGLGAHFYLLNAGFHVVEWLPTISVLGFVIAYYTGLMSVPNAVLGELFPSDIKCFAGFIASLDGAIWSFAVTRSFQPLVDCIGKTYVFWLHGVCAILVIPFVCFFMPETKGKSLQEIQDQLIQTS